MTCRQYMILPADAVPLIDFALVCETSAETMRYNLDRTHCVVKWYGAMPDFLAEIPGAQGPYDHDTILAILATPAWTSDAPYV